MIPSQCQVGSNSFHQPNKKATASTEIEETKAGTPEWPTLVSHVIGSFVGHNPNDMLCPPAVRSFTCLQTVHTHTLLYLKRCSRTNSRSCICRRVPAIKSYLSSVTIVCIGILYMYDILSTLRAVFQKCGPVWHFLSAVAHEESSNSHRIMLEPNADPHPANPLAKESIEAYRQDKKEHKP